MERTNGVALWLVRVLVLFTVAAAILPVGPVMPGAGLDNSWVYALSEAVSAKLVFGRDVVFTLGPYASIYTSLYHPATYHLALIGSACLVLGFGILLPFLLAGRSPVLSFLVIFFLACAAGAPDATLLLYPLLLSLFIYRLTLSPDHSEKGVVSDGTLSYLAIATLFGIMGLIPLIKGSLLILALTVGGLCVLRLCLTGRARLAVVAIAASIAGLLLFWQIAGQSLSALPSYFASMFPIASGYTEAMSTKGKSSQLFIFLIPCLSVAIAIFVARCVALLDKLYLLCAFGLFLFLAFKEGFVRHDAHATIAGSALFLAGLFLCTVLSGKARWATLALCVGGWFVICNAYYPVTLSGSITQGRNVYARLGTGLWAAARGTNNFDAVFERARKDIRQQHPIPLMTGTADIYPIDQSYLIASGNKWSPRPVFQSYSVYTPKLAELNRLHLLGPTAPDNIVFSLQPIDQRLPALDDGLSWPVLMGLYKPVRYENGYVFLEKIHGDVHVPKLTSLSEQDHRLRETVAIPNTNLLIFAQIRMKKTLLGRLQGILFKPEELKITMQLLDGTVRIYRFIPGMAEAGFILSPTLENSTEFLLSYGQSKFLDNKKVVSIEISTKSRHPVSWAGYK